MIGFLRGMAGVLRTPCSGITALLDRRLDTPPPLPPGVAAGLRIHTLYCNGCARYNRQVRLLRTLLGMMAAEPLPAEARERLLRCCEDHGKKI
jgi:hypothetical protein